MELMDTTWVQHWTTTDVTNFKSQKQKGTRIVDDVEFYLSNTAMPQTSSKDFSAIAALEMSNALQNPSPADNFSHICTAQLQAFRQLSEILSAALPPRTAQHAPPMSQALPQFRDTVPPAPVTI
jgi:hypothetical protein